MTCDYELVPDLDGPYLYPGGEQAYVIVRPLPEEYLIECLELEGTGVVDARGRDDCLAVLEVVDAGAAGVVGKDALSTEG